MINYALYELKKRLSGQILEDGKTIGGRGRLTKDVIESLQNYYGKAIRGNVGDVTKMMKAVQATLQELSLMLIHVTTSVILAGVIFEGTGTEPGVPPQGQHP